MIKFVVGDWYTYGGSGGKKYKCSFASTEFVRFEVHAGGKILQSSYNIAMARRCWFNTKKLKLKTTYWK